MRPLATQHIQIHTPPINLHLFLRGSCLPTPPPNTFEFFFKKIFPLENRSKTFIFPTKKKAKGEENTIQIKDDTLAHWPDHATWGWGKRIVLKSVQWKERQHLTKYFLTEQKTLIDRVFFLSSTTFYAHVSMDKSYNNNNKKKRQLSGRGERVLFFVVFFSLVFHGSEGGGKWKTGDSGRGTLQNNKQTTTKNYYVLSCWLVWL